MIAQLPFPHFSLFLARMQLVDQIKSQFHPAIVQVITFTTNGFLVDTCNTYLNLEAHRHESMFKLLPFLDDHARFIRNLSDQSQPRITGCMAIDLDGQHITASATIFMREGMAVCVLDTGICQTLEEGAAAGMQSDIEHQPEQNAGQLREELDKLRIARKLKSEYFHKIAHDIKLPLTEIVGTTYLLQNYVKDEKGQEYLKVLTQSALTLDKMLKDLLEFSRLEATDIPFDRKPFSI